jgi:hypothetical protein
MESEDRVDPMSRIFIKVTKCTFHKYGLSGTVENHDGLCSLTLNVVNEKIFVFLVRGPVPGDGPTATLPGCCNRGTIDPLVPLAVQMPFGISGSDTSNTQQVPDWGLVSSAMFLLKMLML